MFSYKTSRECEIGRGGTAYTEGHISIEDSRVTIAESEEDKDRWGDIWYRRNDRYTIHADNYTKLIGNLLGIGHTMADIEPEDQGVRGSYNSLRTEDAKKLFLLMICVLKNMESWSARGLVSRLCGDKVRYHTYIYTCDDFFPDCDSCNSTREYWTN